MAHKIRLADDAESDLARMPTWLQSSVEAYLLRTLAESPTSVSRPSVTPPYPPGGMISETQCGPIDGETYYVTVFFRYNQDETSLIVSMIGFFRSV